MTGCAPRSPSPFYAPSPLGGSYGTAPDRRRKVLLVEDDWLIALEIEAALQDGGYDVVGTAVSADEAVEIALATTPALVVMDVRLHGQRDGIDAALEIYRTLGVRSVFISANDDPSTRERAKDANPFGWMSKPFQGTQLVAFIDGLVATRS